MKSNNVAHYKLYMDLKSIIKLNNKFALNYKYKLGQLKMY